MDKRFLVDDKIFQQARDRWDNTNLDKLDAPIVGVLKTFNRHPNVVTLWSCSSHPTNEKIGNGHVAVLINDEKGLNYLIDVFITFNNEIEKRFRSFSRGSIALKHIFLNNIFDQTERSDYPVHWIGFQTNSKIRSDIIAKLGEVALDFLPN